MFYDALVPFAERRKIIMKILYYMLGFPPYRSGGLTKYAVDLAKAQVKDGHEVLSLWPGQIKSYSTRPYIKEGKSVSGIRSLELINPLPVSLDEGIKEFNSFTRSCDVNIYIEFLKKEAPDVIHIHTLMGLHKEFIQAANRLNIRTVMTSHDYFGFCPKVTLYRYGKCCDDDNGCRDCIQCNTKPLSLRKIQIMQSPLYRWAKETLIMKKLRKYHRSKFFSEEVLPEMPDVNVEEMGHKYRKLRAYYVGMYEMIDFIHFNSTVTEKIYKRYMIPKQSKVISITHQGINQHKRNKIKTGKKVILCLAPAKPFKGWNVLKEACDQLWRDGENIELRVYSPVFNPSSYMVIKEDGFTHVELEKIMNEADVLVAPSIWYETFGFTVQEALSYGVPVIVSNHVGAKDIIGDNGMVVKAGDVNELRDAIKIIDKKVNGNVKKWKQFLQENYEIYKGERI